ncbi:DUF835 domain-containing protein [Pyrococcus furiosus DSM 3638]|uniref:DUF835 domain-containing protein n=4 Tax=Pyrococcus TaxID=2260 RepID=A0A5C0XNV1_PYRFU|nr:DUF835 domain-containing protein [Pyrococcus furiosus]AAL80295.1 hypothetical protein PF0171 [Pyrococcus furiosus DSM 3638]AFN04405.1 hypothetical protein PFC_07345 [Pyrococcus furiosus COM1]QEK77898.1 DUF835 domain-containing protein [Pyrococcus furiosus DSM 3638]
MITHGGGAGGLVVLYIIFLHLLEKFSFPEVSFDIKRGKAYLVKNFEEIKGIIDAIHPSSILAIAREIEKYKDITTHIVWVTNVPEKGVNPTALHVLLDLSIRFANEHENALIILDCLEFLVLYNGFELTFKFLLSLKDNLLIRGATLIIVVKPETFNEQQLTLLKREFQTL